jgi:hypothetical protein
VFNILTFSLCNDTSIYPLDNLLKYANIINKRFKPYVEVESTVFCITGRYYV